MPRTCSVRSARATRPWSTTTSTTVREIERRVDQIASRDLSSVQLPDAPAGIPSRFDEHIRLMFDMIALAFQANLTRVATFMMAAEVSNQPYNFIGISRCLPSAVAPRQQPAEDGTPGAGAGLSHAGVREVREEARRDLPDGEGTMLDNSFILFGSNMSDSNLHNHYPLPTAIVGGGWAPQGQPAPAISDRTPIANVHLTLLQTAWRCMRNSATAPGVEI